MSDDINGSDGGAVARRTLLAGAAALPFAAGAAGASPRKGTGVQPYRFLQVDVFSPERFRGNPLAVVVGADDLTDDDMKLFSRWTNLSETTFLMRPSRPDADYRVRIFSVGEELPFAGHPTLGTCHAWLASGGKPRGEIIVQECPIGLVRLHRTSGRLAFEAPPLRRASPMDAEMLARVRKGLGLTDAEIVATSVLDAGLEQPALMIRSRARLLELKPDWSALGMEALGVIAPFSDRPAPGQPDFEVRMFDVTLANFEDPVTGSLNASLARWLIGAGLAPEHYVASQGTVLGRTGRIHVDQDADGLWIGGDTTTRIEGVLNL
ncbi:PhzF family phenazine biosynthesis protein [Phenylobacterium aquaticum]|uniref:PhzF family phenazine biosynthesis protein n=1 Tax=Phenylobacterium aquaticum TaxID=1763816 RepID=UPI001F5E0900|nr:PhzF family phenazine biosynthesis protein [Phenylobacterium aquaticum]